MGNRKLDLASNYAGAPCAPFSTWGAQGGTLQLVVRRAHPTTEWLAGMMAKASVLANNVEVVLEIVLQLFHYDLVEARFAQHL